MTRNRPHQSHQPRRRQRGQAMTEFVVGTVFFLLPLFLIVPMLGKYSDIKATAAQSARYAAWERTIWYAGDASSNAWPGNTKSDADIEREARQRVVSYKPAVADSKLKSNDRSLTNFANSGGRFMWKNADQSSLVKSSSDAANSLSMDKSPDIATGDVLGAIIAVTSITGFDLETKGLYTGNSAITVKTNPIGASLSGSTNGKFNPGTMIFRDKNVILANGWSANGSSHVKSMAAGIAPVSLLNDGAVKEVLQVATCALMAAFTPELCFLEIGKMEPDIVPPDRLTP